MSVFERFFALAAESRMIAVALKVERLFGLQPPARISCAAPNTVAIALEAFTVVVFRSDADSTILFKRVVKVPSLGPWQSQTPVS